MSKKLEEIYGDKFFAHREHLAKQAPLLAEAVIATFQPGAVLDVGCATGYLIAELRKKGVGAWGVEGSPAAQAHFVVDPELIEMRDLRECQDWGRKSYDLVVAIEVAEHIEEEYADVFLDNLTTVANNVLITAAPPGQPGTHHVNCQKAAYWDEKMAARHYKRIDIAERRYRAVLEPHREERRWEGYYNNVLCYRGPAVLPWARGYVKPATLVPGMMKKGELRWLGNRASRCRRIVEVGSWEGRSARAMLDSSDATVYCVDPFTGSGQHRVFDDVRRFGVDGVYELFCTHLKPHIDAGRVHAIRKKSDDAIEDLLAMGLTGKVDLVFLDGDHTYNGVCSDIRNYFPLLRQGGVLCGHDCDQKHKDVWSAVYELCPKASRGAHTIWCYQVTGEEPGL